MLHVCGGNVCQLNGTLSKGCTSVPTLQQGTRYNFCEAPAVTDVLSDECVSRSVRCHAPRHFLCPLYTCPRSLCLLHCLPSRPSALAQGVLLGCSPNSQPWMEKGVLFPFRGSKNIFLPTSNFSPGSHISLANLPNLLLLLSGPHFLPTQTGNLPHLLSLPRLPQPLILSTYCYEKKKKYISNQ